MPSPPDEETKQQLSEILEQIGISRVYFVDDAVDLIDDLDQFLGKVAQVIAEGKKAQLEEIKLQGINFGVPENAVRSHIRSAWNNINKSKQKKYIAQIFKIAGEENTDKDFKAISGVKNFFTKGIDVQTLSPNKWNESREEILESIGEGEKLLVLLDQDLKYAGGEFESRKGADLIVALKQHIKDKKVICALLTHTISEVSHETSSREEICNDKELEVEDFFPLAKKRLENVQLFSDGIKKAVLNGYCETLKSETIKIIKTAYKKTANRVKAMDTYVFDRAVLKSSLNEGVWEPTTLFRMINFIFADYSQEEMIKRRYSAQVNPDIDLANNINQINFGMPESEGSYEDHIELRKQELYERAELVNGLYKPIENGDIFRATNATKSENYILISQPCDLMVRAEGLRNTKFVTLMKITEKKQNDSKLSISKHRLPYYSHTEQKLFEGIVNFKEIIVADIDFLDLVVYNQEGVGKIDLNTNSACPPNFHAPWKKRHEIIVKKLKTIRERIENSKADLSKVEEESVRKNLLELTMPKVSFPCSIGKSVSYEDGIFDFGIERINRFRRPGADYLLEKFTKYNSRTAEPHDFAKKQ